MEVRLMPQDVGSRVVVRWRRPVATGPGEAAGLGEASGPGEEVADVLGILEAADDVSFVVRKASGDVVTIPRERALAAKTIPARASKTSRQVPPGR